MTEHTAHPDRFRAYLVPLATLGTIVFNWISATGRLGGVTPAEISARYPTPITPSGYAFSIWTLIYVGMIAFSVYQLLPANVGKFRGIRTLYILSCVLNCGWIYMWHSERVMICFVLITLLAICLFLVNLNLRKTEGSGEYWLVKAPFSLYFGWITAATLVSFMIFLAGLIQLSDAAWMWTGVVMILFAALLGVVIRIRLVNYLYPLAIAWALTAIGVKQSGATMIVVAAAVGTIACLIAAGTFVLNMPSTDNPRQ